MQQRPAQHRMRQVLGSNICMSHLRTQGVQELQDHDVSSYGTFIPARRKSKFRLATVQAFATTIPAGLTRKPTVYILRKAA